MALGRQDAGVSNGLIALIAGLIAADLIVTAVLIGYLRRKRRREESPSSEGW